MATSAPMSRNKRVIVWKRRLRSLNVAIACFLCMALSAGTGTSMSVLVADLLRYFRESKFAISWFNGISLSVANVSALVWMVALRKLSHRYILLIGILTTCLGQFSAAFSTHVSHLYVSLGLITGIGFGAMDFVSLSTAGEYFERNGYFAIAFVSSGSAAGSVLLPVLLNCFIDVYTWRGALIILGATTIQVAPLVCCMSTENRLSSKIRKQTTSLENADSLDDETFLALKDEEDQCPDLDKEIMDCDGSRNVEEGQCSPDDVEVVRHTLEAQSTPRDEYRINLKNLEAIPSIRENIVYLLATFRFYSLSFSTLFSAICCSVFFTFNVDFYLHAGFSNADSVVFLLCAGIGNVCSRLAAGVVSSRLKGRRCVILLTATLLLVVSNTFLALFTDFLLYCFLGFFSGAAYGFTAVGLAICTLEQFTITRYREGVSLMTVAFGLGMLIGPSMGGFVFDLTQDYRPVFMMCLGISLLSAAAILPIVCLKPPNNSMPQPHTRDIDIN